MGHLTPLKGVPSLIFSLRSHEHEGQTTKRAGGDQGVGFERFGQVVFS